MNRLFLLGLFVCASLFFVAQSLRAEQQDHLFVYFGTNTNETSKGIYVSRFDSTNGKLAPAELAAELKNPSFLAIHPSRKFLYAVSEVSDYQGQKVGAVYAFAIEPTNGQLVLLNEQQSAGGGPIQLVVDAAGKNVLVANYRGGSVAVLPIDSTGRLAAPTSSIQHQGSSIVKKRQDSAHAHSINLDPANKIAFVPDLGIDQVLIYRFDGEQGLLTPNDPALERVPAGSGPRHFAFHPSGKYAFMNCELTSMVTAYAYDSNRGSLTEIQSLTTLPEPTQGNANAEIVVHPTGKFVYVSNRGHNSIAIFRCDESTGRLTSIGHQSTEGKTPRNFNIDPSGRYLLAANQDSSNVVVLKIDGDTGMLAATGNSIELNRPVCIRFLQTSN